MKSLMLVLVVLIIAVSATSALAQEPPALRYYRLDEPSDSSASRAHAVAVDDSGMVIVGGEVRVGSLMVAS